MVKFTVEQVRSIMDNQDNIRNMSVIAHVDHGKSTLSDALICKAGILSEKAAGEKRALDMRKDQIQRGITIKSTGVSLYYKHDITNSGDPANQKEYLINLIDSPGHVDFSSEVTAALRVTDGALVVVDTIEGVCVQTETVLRQAMQEKIKPVLMINKVDRAILEQKLEGEDMYKQFIRVIDIANVTITTYQSQDMGDLSCQPTIGNVAFGAGKDQWAFTLNTFARMYSKKFEIPAEKLVNKLWGDNFYDNEAGKWTTQPYSETGKPLKRAFVEFIMDPICKLCRAIMAQDKKQYEQLVGKLNIHLTQEDKKQTGKALLKTVMSKWISAADTLMEMIINHLPSPKKAQSYRALHLYEGPTDDMVYEAMKNCDPKGPLMVYISKMIPLDNNRFAAFGRIFSGTLCSGQKIRIMGANFKHGHHHDVFEKNVSQVGVYMMGKIPQFVPDVPCGNTVAVIGIDDHLLKTGTLGCIDVVQPYPIKSMKYSVSPVYRVAVRVKNPADLPKLQKGLTRLSKSDPLVKIDVEETGEIVVAGSGELHVEICLNDLRELSQCEIIVMQPTVTYKQTITKEVNVKLLTKSANKHNRFFGTTEILQQELIQMIQGGDISESMDIKERSKILASEFAWDKDQASRIWCFGPENVGANILVDLVKGAQYMTEVKDSVTTAFQSASRCGALAEQNMRGVRFNIIDSVLHSDHVHRNGAQIQPCARRLFKGLQLASTPTLLEPIFMCEITAPTQVLGGVYQTINQRRGQIIQEIKVENSPLHIVKAYLPVAESFGLTSVLRSNTKGMAFPQCFFDHWEKISGIPLEDVKATQIVKQIRKRKGLKEEIPSIEDYLDKL